MGELAITTDMLSFKHRLENSRNGWGIWGIRVLGVLGNGENEISKGNLDGLNVEVNGGLCQ